MPRQSPSQAIGQEGERWFAAQLPPKWIPQAPSTDVGVDFLVVVCEDGPLNGLEFRVQVKCANLWSVRDDHIVVPGFKRTSFADLVYGFTPSLLVLYQASSKSGWCYWLNQLLAQSPGLLRRAKRKTITLRVPTSRPVNSDLWPMLGNELRGVTSALGRRLVMAGHYFSVIKATQVLMRSLHLIDLCAKANESRGPLSKLTGPELDQLLATGEDSKVGFPALMDAEMTAHREIATTLLDLDQMLKESGSPILGVGETAKKYIETCEKFLPNFSALVQAKSTAGMRFDVAPDLMARHREKAVRFVTQVVGRLTELTLQDPHPEGPDGV